MILETLEKIASQIIESYKFRLKRQRRSRGSTRTRRHRTYIQHRPRIRAKTRIYRMRTKIPRKRRQRLKHYHRIG
jgi:hypothetical protein